MKQPSIFKGEILPTGVRVSPKKQLLLYARDLVLLALVFLAAAVPRLGYDPFSGDELVPASLAVNTVTGRANERHTDLYVTVLGRTLPVNRICAYDFALPSYVLLPYVKAFGASIIGVKFVGLGVGLAYILVLFIALALLFDRRVAFLSVLFLELSPQFLQYVRAGFNITEPFISLPFTAAIICLVAYRRRGNDFLLAAAFLLLGLGLSVKLSAVSRYVALAVAAAFVYRGTIRERLAAVTRRQVIIAAASFAAGAAVFLYYNVMTGGATFGLLRFLVTGQPTTSGASNFDLAAHVVARIGQLNVFVTDMVEPSFRAQVSDWRLAPLLSRLLFFAGLWGLLLFNASERDPRRRRTVTGLLVFFGTMFCTTFFSPGSWRPFHLFVLYPFPQLVLALFIVKLSVRPPRGRQWATGLLVLALLVKVLMLLDYHAAIGRYAAGRYTNDEGVGMLIRYICANNEFSLVTTDFDTDEALYALSNGVITSVHVQPGQRIDEVARAQGDPAVIESEEFVRERKARLSDEYPTLKPVFEIRNKNNRDTLYTIYRNRP